MRKTDSKTKAVILIILSWALVLLLMAVIFALSNQVAEDSTQLSQGLLERICALFGIHVTDDHVLRKIAHASEYFLLEILIFHALYRTKDKPMPLTSVALTALYSVSDEIHQYFVPGRACRVGDMIIDFSGAIVAMILCLVGLKIIKVIVLKMKNKC